MSSHYRVGEGYPSWVWEYPRSVKGRGHYARNADSPEGSRSSRIDPIPRESVEKIT